MKSTMMTALAVTCAFFGAQQIDAKELRMASISPASSPWAKMEAAFAAKVGELSGGELTVAHFPAGQLGNQGAAMKSTLAGRIDIWSGPMPALGSIAPELNVLSFPNLMASWDEAACVLPKVSDNVDDMLGDRLHFITFMPVGFHGIASKEPVRTPEDMQNVKTRVAQLSAPIAYFRSIGANAVPLAAVETPSSFSTGLIDASDDAFPFYIGVGTSEIARNFTMTKHYFNSAAFAASGRVWNRLSEEEQGWITQAAAEAVPLEATTATIQQVEGALQKMLTDAGGTYVELSDEEQAAWAATGTDIHDDIMAELSGDPQPFYDEVQAALTECR